MAKSIVTKELVFEAAGQLLKENIEPSILNVQNRIGAGSFTTVKRFLDEWEAQVVSKAPVEIPSIVSERAQTLVQTLWTSANQLAQQESQKVKEEALADVSAARKELSDALNELQRLERVEVEQNHALEEKTHHIRELELNVATLEVAAKRVAELQSELDTLRASFARAEQEARSLREQAEKANAVQSSLTELQTKVEALIAGQRKEKS